MYLHQGFSQRAETFLVGGCHLPWMRLFTVVNSLRQRLHIVCQVQQINEVTEPCIPSPSLRKRKAKCFTELWEYFILPCHIRFFCSNLSIKYLNSTNVLLSKPTERRKKDYYYELLFRKKRN